MPQQRFEPVPVPTRWWERAAGPALPIAAVLLLLALVAVLVPVPYAVRMPGPTFDTLGSGEAGPLITVQDAPTYPADGELRLTTVAVSGGPGYPVTAMKTLQGMLDSRSSVVPREVVFPTAQSREEATAQSQAQMTSSQENATVAALEQLGYDVPMVLTVAGLVDGGASAGVLEPGDVLLFVTSDGGTSELTSFRDLAEVLATVPPGSDIEIGVRRDGEELVLPVVTGDDGTGGSQMGVLVSPTFELPVQVDIEIEDVGGPSAGMMFALGIMDVLQEEDATGGQVIAGTGTINLAGEVGPIGGIVQKMYGSVRDGAEYFLAPLANCADVAGNVPSGLQVVAVETLGQAWDAVSAIGRGEAADLPSC